MSTLGAVVDSLSLVDVSNGRFPVLASFSATQLEALAVSLNLNPKLVLRCNDLAQTVFANVQTAIEPHRQVTVPAAAVAAISSNLAIAAGPLSTELETGVVDHLLTTTRAVHELVKAVDPLLGVARKDGNLRFVRELETPSGSAETPLTFCTRFDAIYTEGEAPPPQRNAWLAEIGNPKLILCEAKRRDADHYIVGLIVTSTTSTEFDVLLSPCLPAHRAPGSDQPSLAEILFALHYDLFPQADRRTLRNTVSAKHGPPRPASIDDSDGTEQGPSSADESGGSDGSYHARLGDHGRFPDTRGGRMLLLEVVDPCGYNVLGQNVISLPLEPEGRLSDHYAGTDGAEAAALHAALSTSTSSAASGSTVSSMRSDDSGFVSGKSLILLRPKQREETDSILSALTVKPDGLVKIVVQRIRKSSPQNFVYDASGWPGEATIVLKITSSGGDSARDLRQDVELRRGPLVNEPDCIVPVLALFQSSADSKKRILIAVYKCGGEGLETWQDLNEDARAGREMGLKDWAKVLRRVCRDLCSS
ncbi:hypothetical protein Rhopal_007822-T1 [Rhodotorula paludigena]|uniref:Uncharacterized protein n=1 Tax=Rhodotorula paludigena TaxID=86838 RepID=A0AAV5GQQ4_9BASI|nr:hypothetical protein Rhopal_007822-T1 [Rhodotorula paludigena]